MVKHSSEFYRIITLSDGKSTVLGGSRVNCIGSDVELYFGKDLAKISQGFGVKLTCNDFSALLEWFPKQTISCTLHTW